MVPDDVRQAPAGDVVHREVVLPLVLPDFVDGHDAGVLQVGGGFRLSLETLHIAGEASCPARIILRATVRWRLTCRAL